MTSLYIYLPAHSEDSLKTGRVHNHLLLQQQGIEDQDALNTKLLHHLCTHRKEMKTSCNTTYLNLNTLQINQWEWAGYKEAT